MHQPTNQSHHVNETGTAILATANIQTGATTTNKSGCVPRYENNDENNTTAVLTSSNRNNSNYPTSYRESEKLSASSQDSVVKPVQPILRVSFDEDSNTTEFTEHFSQNYEDVLTLHVPTKSNFWNSCRLGRGNKRTRFNCFDGSTVEANNISYSNVWRKSRRSKHELSTSALKANSNGNHLNSIYENEGEEAKQNITDLSRHPPTVGLHCATNSATPFLGNSKPGYASVWNNDPNEKSGLDLNADSMVWTTNFLAALSILIIILTFPFSLIYCIRIVAEYERAVVLRMGNLIPKGKGTKGPGLFFILPCIDSVRKVDLRTITFAIPPQELLTRDSVTVSVDAVVYYRVLNPVASVLNIEDAARSTRLLAQTTIRNVLGTKDLAQILMDRDEISTSMQSSLDATTDAWGVKVERVEIKDVRLPIQLQRAMAAEAEAAREARAKVIAATGEQEAARSLKKAARVIATSPMAFQLRYLQTLCAISAEKNSTIFFPVPIDIMQNLGTFGSCGGYGTTSKLGKISGWMRTQVQTVKPSAPSFPDNENNVHQIKDINDIPQLVADSVENKKDVKDEMIIPLFESNMENAIWSHDDADEQSDTV